VDSVPQERLVEAIQEFSVGMMPLIDDPWSEGKCGYKALLTMACGIPTVASPVGVNRDIVRHGENGFLAGTEEEWYRSLAFVLTHREEALSIGLRGRRAVEERYSQTVCERRMLEVVLQVASGDVC
jgi:glycosyltransferase involved in cell wall biosynthesis